MALCSCLKGRMSSLSALGLWLPGKAGSSWAHIHLPVLPPAGSSTAQPPSLWGGQDQRKEHKEVDEKSSRWSQHRLCSIKAASLGSSRDRSALCSEDNSPVSLLISLGIGGVPRTSAPFPTPTAVPEDHAQIQGRE